MKTSVFEAEDKANVIYKIHAIQQLVGAVLDRNELSSDLTFYNLYIVRWRDADTFVFPR